MPEIKESVIGALIFGLVLSGITWAQESNEKKPEEKKNKPEEVEEIIVTATKTPRKANDLPVQTTVITNKKIKESNSKNVTEVLRTIPGFYIQGENAPGSSAYRSRLQGLDFDRGYGLVLIDGERVLGGGMGEYGVGINQIPPEMIDRIEVVKGPGSVLYGSDAVVGVVNIITKPIPEKPVVTSALGTGSYDTTLKNVSYGQQIKDFGFFLSAQQEASKRGRYGAAEDDFEGEYILSKLSYKLSPSATLALGLSYDDLNWEYMTEEKSRTSPSFDVSFSDDSTLKIKGYLYKYYLNSFSPGYTPRYGDIVYTQLETQYTRPFGATHLATIGAEYLDRNIDANFAEETDIIKSFYLQDEINLKQVNLIIGERVDNHSTYGTESNPKASVLWKITGNTSLRTSVGKAFKSPTIRQSYVFFKHGSWWNVPNPDLEPETSWGYSTGIEHAFSGNLSVTINVFRNDINNLIIPVQIGAITKTWQNVQKAFTQGMEFGTKTTILEDLSLNLGYTYLDTENKDTVKELTYSPRNTANIGVGYEIKPWKLSLHWQTNFISDAYTDEANTTKIGNHAISNLNAIKKIAENYTLSINVDNIFDSDYGEPTKEWLGRVTFVKLTFNF